MAPHHRLHAALLSLSHAWPWLADRSGRSLPDGQFTAFRVHMAQVAIFVATCSALRGLLANSVLESGLITN